MEAQISKKKNTATKPTASRTKLKLNPKNVTMPIQSATPNNRLLGELQKGLDAKPKIKFVESPAPKFEKAARSQV